MIDTQFSRRNLDAPDRILLAQKKAPILERLAKQRQREYYGNQYDNRTVVQMDKSPSSETSFVQMDNDEKLAINQPTIRPVSKPEPKEPPKLIHVREEVAKIAGVSSGTVA